MGLLFTLLLLVIGYSTGKFFETTHYTKIRQREKRLQSIPIIASRWQDTIESDEMGCLFDGSVVISSDYFKAFISKLRLILGGRMREFEPLLDRARREAILRMKEKAVFWGAKRIINLRIECSSVYGRGGGQQYLPIVEVLAYGTGIKKNTEK